MLEIRMTVVVVVVPAIYSYAIFGDKNYSSAQIIHFIPFAIQVSKYSTNFFFQDKMFLQTLEHQISQKCNI